MRSTTRRCRPPHVGHGIRWHAGASCENLHVAPEMTWCQVKVPGSGGKVGARGVSAWWPRAAAAPRGAPRRGRRSARGSRGRSRPSTSHGSCTAAPGQVRELGHPPPHVVAVGVEAQPLGDRVEDPEVRRGVGAGAGHPLPAVVVRGDVAVDEVLEEVPRPDRPPHVQVLGEEARRDHPHPVVHPALGEQLAHPGVDDRVAGAARPPRLDARPPARRSASATSRAAGRATPCAAGATARRRRTRARRARSRRCARPSHAPRARSASSVRGCRTPSLR